MTMITPSYLGETIEYSSLHACRSTLEDPTEQPTQPSDYANHLLSGLPLDLGAIYRIRAVVELQDSRRSAHAGRQAESFRAGSAHA